MRARRRRGRRRADGEAGAAVPRRAPRRARPVRPAARRLQRERRVRDGEGRRGGRRSRRARRRGRVADGDPPRRRRPRLHVLGEGIRPVGSDAHRALAPGARPDPGRRQLSRARDARRRARRAVLRGARRGRATSRRPTAAASSTGCSRGGRSSSGTPIRRRSRRCARRRSPARRSARRRSARSSSPRRSSTPFPSVERVRLVSSGTEAAMSALRLARGFTRRDRVITFAGCYHGHADPFLARAGSGLATLGIASSPGVPSGVVADTIVCEYNDVDGVASAVERYGEGLAAIFVEPVAGNMGCVPPAPGFLEALRLLCDAVRRAARLRRGDHRLPRRARRRAGALRRHARPDGAREDRRRRPAARRVRRPRRRDGAARAVRRRLPGRHAEREPARDRRRRLGAAAAARSRGLRRARATRGAARRRLAPFGRVQRVGAMLTLFAGRDEPVERFERARHRGATPSSSAACSSAASTSRRASTSASSRHSPTPTTIDRPRPLTLFETITHER